MNVIRILLALALILIVVLLLAVILSAVKRAYTEKVYRGASQSIDKCVDLLVVDATFTLDPPPAHIQGTRLENGMSLIVQTNTTDDGVYIVMHSMLIRLIPLLGGDVYKVLYGLYRNTIYTVPQASEAKLICSQRGSTLRHLAESFIIVPADDLGLEFPLVTTDLCHIVSIVNQSPDHAVPFNIFEHTFEVPPMSSVRYLLSVDVCTKM